LRLLTRFAGALGPAALLAACGGNNAGDTIGTGYTIGGTVGGLSASGLVLQNNGGDTLPVSSGATSFAFPNKIPDGGSYAVTVSQQPTGQTCAVANGSGTATGDVGDVAVICAAVSPSYTLSASVSGLASGQRLILLVNGTPSAPVTSNTSSLALGSVTADDPGYALSIQSGAWYGADLATGTYCTVQNGSGTATANVSDIAIRCAAGEPSRIDLATGATATQNGISYAGWSLQYPYVNNGQLYYQVMADQVSNSGNWLSINMTQLQTLFNGSTTPPMNATGDPVAPGANNYTTLQTANLGAVSVAIPTFQQLVNINCIVNGQGLNCGGGYGSGNSNMPPGWTGGGAIPLWSSTQSGSSHYAMYRGYSGVSLSDNTPWPVAFQVR
jgi:hypothetical protein